MRGAVWLLLAAVLVLAVLAVLSAGITVDAVLGQWSP